MRLAFASLLGLIFSVPALQVPIEGLGSVTRVFGLITLLLWLFTIPRYHLRKPHSYHTYAFLFFIYAFISLGWTQNFENATDNILRYLQSIGITFIVWDLARNTKNVTYMLYAYVLGCVASIVFIFIDYIQVSVFGNWVMLTGGRYTNSGFSGFDPNDIALQLVIGIPIAWHIFIIKKNDVSFLKYIYWIYPILAIAAVILTGSRGGIISAVPAILYIVSQFRASRMSISSRIVFLLLCVISGLFVAQLDIGSNWDRFMSIPAAVSTDRLAGRLDIWTNALHIFNEAPWLGVGPGNFSYQSFLYSGDSNVAHNLFLSVLCEGGIIGFILFGAILIVVSREVIKHKGEELAVWSTVLICWGIGVCSLSWQYLPQTWLLFMFIITDANSSPCFIDGVPPRNNSCG